MRRRRRVGGWEGGEGCRRMVMRGLAAQHETRARNLLARFEGSLKKRAARPPAPVRPWAHGGAVLFQPGKTCGAGSTAPADAARVPVARSPQRRPGRGRGRGRRPRLTLRPVPSFSARIFDPLAARRSHARTHARTQRARQGAGRPRAAAGDGTAAAPPNSLRPRLPRRTLRPPPRFRCRRPTLPTRPPPPAAAAVADYAAAAAAPAAPRPRRWPRAARRTAAAHAILLAAHAILLALAPPLSSLSFPRMARPGYDRAISSACVEE